MKSTGKDAIASPNVKKETPKKDILEDKKEDIEEPMPPLPGLVSSLTFGIPGNPAEAKPKTLTNIEETKFAEKPEVLQSKGTP